MYGATVYHLINLYILIFSIFETNGSVLNRHFAPQPDARAKVQDKRLFEELQNDIACILQQCRDFVNDKNYRDCIESNCKQNTKQYHKRLRPNYEYEQYIDYGQVENWDEYENSQRSYLDLENDLEEEGIVPFEQDGEFSSNLAEFETLLEFIPKRDVQNLENPSKGNKERTRSLKDAYGTAIDRQHQNIDSNILDLFTNHIQNDNQLYENSVFEAMENKYRERPGIVDSELQTTEENGVASEKELEKAMRTIALLESYLRETLETIEDNAITNQNTDQPEFSEYIFKFVLTCFTNICQALSKEGAELCLTTICIPRSKTMDNSQHEDRDSVLSSLIHPSENAFSTFYSQPGNENFATNAHAQKREPDVLNFKQPEGSYVRKRRYNDDIAFCILQHCGHYSGKERSVCTVQRC